MNLPFLLDDKHCTHMMSAERTTNLTLQTITTIMEECTVFLTSGARDSPVPFLTDDSRAHLKPTDPINRDLLKAGECEAGAPFLSPGSTLLILHLSDLLEGEIHQRAPIHGAARDRHPSLKVLGRTPAGAHLWRHKVLEPRGSLLLAVGFLAALGMAPSLLNGPVGVSWGRASSQV